MNPPGLTLRNSAAKPGARVAGVMQDAVADHQIEAVVGERRAEQVHLQEGGVGDGVLLAKAVRQPERIQTDVAAEHPPPWRQSEEIGQLPGAAAGFQHHRALGQLRVERAQQQVRPRLGDEALRGLAVGVIGKRGLLVERLDQLGDVAGGHRGIDRREELGDAVHHRIAAPRRGELIIAGNEGLAGSGADEDRGAVAERRRQRRQRGPLAHALPRQAATAVTSAGSIASATAILPLSDR